ncbi:MAG: right-handed parallel beta-helix repeat-containing protein [Dyadobacter sp.]|uniref:right-handed parallel beta-helix repeat-containing protein n=1 Tax=Dyadobacter sp. TaxID=1914288 RepID=UPI003264A252
MRKIFTKRFICLVITCLVTFSISYANPKIDPIKFTLSTDATTISLNQEFEIKITASYQAVNPNLVFVFKGATSFRIKVAFPEGFRQTGGTYADYIGTELSSSKQTVSYTLKGKFISPSSDGTFLLLRSNQNANSQSDFILAGRLGFTTFSPSDSAIEPSTARIAVITQEYIPYMTIAEFNLGEADSSKVIYINEGKKSGIFLRDDTTPTTDLGSLVLVYGTKRYKRKHDRIFFPEWWGAVGDGVADDQSQLQAASIAAGALKAELKLNFSYAIFSPLTLHSDVSGSGTIWTRSTGEVFIGKDALTIKDIKINGKLSGTVSGKGLSAQNKARITLDNIRVTNVRGVGIWGDGVNYIKVINCTTDSTMTHFGDGIYVGQAINPIISNNHCTHFGRIGIVCEGEPATPTMDAIVTGNICTDAIMSDDFKNYPNAGIWMENTAGATCSENVVGNLFARGIVITPAVENDVQHHYIINNNKIFNVVDGGTNIGRGIAIARGEKQVFDISGNILTDCKRGIEVSYVASANIRGNTFSRKNQPASWFDMNIYLIPSISSWTSEFAISNCVNNVNSTAALPVFVNYVANQKANISISNCIGNFAFANYTYPITGNVSVKGTLMDYTLITGSSSYLSYVTGKSSFEDCDLILPANGQLFTSGSELAINSSRVSSASPALLVFWDTGSTKMRVSNSNFTNVRFHDIKKTDHEFYLYNSMFEGYDATQGLFSAATALTISKLEVDGCTFSKTIIVQPIQFKGVTDARMGNNSYISASLTKNFIPVWQSRTLPVGTTVERPAVTQIGYKYFDTTLSKEIYWDGVEWVIITTAPSFLSNLTSTAPTTKAALNTSFGTLKAGSVVTYQNATNALMTGREFRKLSDGASSDWVISVWATGEKALML